MSFVFFFKQFSVIELFIGTFVSGNLLTLSYGFISGFLTIYFNDLKSANSTFPAGPLTDDQLKYAITFEKIGGLGGNFAIVPLMHFFGVKRTIHLLSLVLIVRETNRNIVKICFSSIVHVYRFRLVRCSLFGHKICTIYALRGLWMVLLGAWSSSAFQH